MLLRLDKYLCDLSVDTRSQVKQIIKKGRVRVNDQVIRKPESKVDTLKDQITLDDIPLYYQDFEYYMLNKPAGVLSAARDKKQPTVLDLIESSRKDLFPVGRLDKDTVGLLLICNDGPMAHRLLSPVRHVDKTYEVCLDGSISMQDIEKLEKGVDIGDEKETLPARIFNIDESRQHMFITIHEGRYHQIKRMFAACGREVQYLKRHSMGPLVLDPLLPEGEFRPLTEAEIELLKKI